MPRKPDDQDIPGDIGKRETERHANFVRNSGMKRKQGAQPGNQNRLKHGIFANKFLTAEEKPRALRAKDKCQRANEIHSRDLTRSSPFGLPPSRHSRAGAT